VLEDSIAGLANVVVTDTANNPSRQALTVQDGSADQARCAVVSLTTTASRNMYVYVPPVTKTYVFRNASAYIATVYASTVAGNTTAAGAGVEIPANGSVLIRCDGTNIVEQLNTIAGDLTVKGTFTSVGSPTIDANLNVTGSTFLGSSQTATISVTSPTIITVAASPETNSAVTFSTTGTLPTGITAGTTYYVSKINATTFFISTSSTLSPLVNVTAVGSGVHTVSTVSLGITSPAGANNTQLATTGFVQTAITSGGTLNGALNYAPPVTLASAATVNIGAAASNVVNITGTTTITSFGTIAAGAVRIVNFQGALILTYNATSMILPGGTSIATAANDAGVFQSLGSGNWKCISYSQAGTLGGVPAGTIIYVAMNATPTGYLKANGAAVSRVGYAALFAAIGTTFGVGDGSTTFNLPDLRGQFTRGWVDDGSVDSGRVFGSTQLDAFQNFGGSASFTSGASGTTLIAGTDRSIFTTGGVGFAPTGSAGFSGARTLNIDPSTQAGVRTSTETRPTNVALLACIKF
jgi:microcystin-dependent protein